MIYIICNKYDTSQIQKNTNNINIQKKRFNKQRKYILYIICTMYMIFVYIYIFNIFKIIEIIYIRYIGYIYIYIKYCIHDHLENRYI